RPRPVAELTVVVVLDHPGPRRMGPPEEGKPPRQAHRYTEGVLVRRRHVDEARVAGSPRTLVDVQALAVDTHRNDPRARGSERAPRSGVAGLLHPRAVAGIQQEAADKLEALLGAGHHEHLVSRAPGPPRRLDVAGNGLAQNPEAGRITVVELGRGDAS